MVTARIQKIVYNNNKCIQYTIVILHFRRFRLSNYDVAGSFLQCHPNRSGKIAYPKKLYCSPHSLLLLVLPVLHPVRCNGNVSTLSLPLFAYITVMLTRWSIWFDCNISSTGSFFSPTHKYISNYWFIKAKLRQKLTEKIAKYTHSHIHTHMYMNQLLTDSKGKVYFNDIPFRC